MLNNTMPANRLDPKKNKIIKPRASLVPPNTRATSKSAGNTPNSSPSLNKSVTRQKFITERDHSPADEELSSSLTDIQINVVDDCLHNTLPASVSQQLKKDQVATKEPPSEKELPMSSPTKGCPCTNLGSKSTVTITCTKCSRKWHTECANLTGLTTATAKKLSKWNCPKCYACPYVMSDDSGNVDTFAEFMKITSDIKKQNEELKESATTIDFFNAHIKHLLLNEDDYKDQSQRIEALEVCMTGIKDIVEVSRLQQKEEIDAINDTLKNITQLMIEDHNSKISKRHEVSDVADLRPVESISASMATIEANSNSLTEDMEILKKVLNECTNTSSESSGVASISNKRFEDLEFVIRDMGKQLDVINDHVCPRISPIPFHIPSEDESHNEDDVSEETPARTPNTRSAHYVPPQLLTAPPCEPYNLYAENVISADVRSKVLEFVSDPTNSFTSVGDSREVLYFGEFTYGYSGAKHNAKETPAVVQELLDCIRPHLPDQNVWLNSCLITKYKDGTSHIPQHCDNEASIDPASVIVTASLGAERTIKFCSPLGESEKSLTPKDSSIYVMTRHSQDFWKHSIDALDEHVDSEPDVDKVRYSFTFRHVAPHFLNSTIIIGDSNTKHIKFGREKGTMGKWVPGQCVRAYKIKDIPPPQEIGPYRNIILHTGINDLTDENRPSNRALITHLKRKCSDIQTVYPNSKLYVSLVLPTKSKFVNNRVNDLNNLILDMVFCHKNMFIIDSSIFGGNEGCMPPKFGRFLSNGLPNSNDIVHLGKSGIRLFSANIKNYILKKRPVQSQARFRASAGNYLGAARRGRVH